MPPTIREWVQEVGEVTAHFQNQFGSLTAAALNWKPDAQTWSIAQNIDHLITINQTYFPVIRQVQAGNYTNPFMGKFPFIASFFGRFILKSVAPERKNKTKTFPIWEPQASQIDASIVNRFAAHQQELIDLIKGCENLMLDKIVIASPASKNIVYTLEKAFQIIISHEKRHFNQANEVWEMQKASK